MYSVTALFLHRNPGHNVKTTLIKTIVKVKVKVSVIILRWLTYYIDYSTLRKQENK